MFRYRLRKYIGRVGDDNAMCLSCWKVNVVETDCVVCKNFGLRSSLEDILVYRIGEKTEQRIIRLTLQSVNKFGFSEYAFFSTHIHAVSLTFKKFQAAIRYTAGHKNRFHGQIVA